MWAHEIDKFALVGHRGRLAERHRVGICLRTTPRRNSDGPTLRHVQLAHNHRLNGVTRAEVLVNLGCEDGLDVPGLRRLVASINRYLGEDPTDATETAGGGCR